MSYINSQTGKELTVEDVEREHDRLRELSKDMPPLIPIGDFVSYGDEEDDKKEDDEEDNDKEDIDIIESHSNYLFNHLCDVSRPIFDDILQSLYDNAEKYNKIELFWRELKDPEFLIRLRREFHPSLRDEYKTSLVLFERFIELKDENKRILNKAVETTIGMTVVI
jgi:hypothetical protein